MNRMDGIQRREEGNQVRDRSVQHFNDIASAASGYLERLVDLTTRRRRSARRLFVSRRIT